MFWVTVSEGIRLKAWKTNPIRSRRRIVSRRSLSPARLGVAERDGAGGGTVEPAATLRNVLLPEPDGPMIAVNDPRASATLIAVEGDDRSVALAVDLADVAKGDRGSAGGRPSGDGEGTGTWRCTLPPRRARSHPACLRPLSARWCREGRPAVPCGSAARLESAADDPLDALGSRKCAARRSSGRARPRRGARPADGPRAAPWFWLALWAAAAAASFVALIPVLFDRGPPVPGQRRDPLALGRVVRGVRPRRVAPAAPTARSARMLTVAGFGVLAPRILGPGRLAARVHARPAVRRAVDHRLRRADPQLRDRRPAHVERRRGARRDVLRRPLRPAVRR